MINHCVLLHELMQFGLAVAVSFSSAIAIVTQFSVQ